MPEKVARKAEREESETTPFTTKNYVLFAVGLLDIILGWFLLRAGHITLAPIMLVAGYCGLIPLAIVLK
ncbi:hypothetical protein JW921_01025 [Candidatus Fermentibacterales bacterium]|nr:hypothetical protein [Candidatus Fermentibacterales bacterium]